MVHYYQIFHCLVWFGHVIKFDLNLIMNYLYQLNYEINLFYKRVNYDPDVVVGFKEIPEDIKERFDVGIPITNSCYISNKIGFFFGKLFRKFIK